MKLSRIIPGQQIGILVQYYKELEEGRQNWLLHEKKTAWRRKRVKTQKQEQKVNKVMILFQKQVKRVCLVER
jgi:hypothetical protein